MKKGALLLLPAGGASTTLNAQTVEFEVVSADPMERYQRVTRAHILTGQIIHNAYGAIMFRSGLV